MKKIISIILSLVMLLSCVPVNAFAAENEEVCAVAPYSNQATLVEVVRDGAPIRTGPGEKYDTVVSCEVGAVLEKTGTKVNRYLNQWYEVTYRDIENNKCYSGYIYSENTQKHSHTYEKLEYDTVTYKFCDCGKITVRVEYRVQKAEAVAVASAAAGTLAVVDGPVPLGDILGAGLLITVGIMEATGAIPDVDTVQSVYEDINFDQFDDDDACPIDSYRRVSRANGNLSYIDKDCLSVVEAYVWVFTGNDVWTSTWDAAYLLASLCPIGCFSEIDSGDKDYWYHFHMGSCTPEGKHEYVIGGHTFYGTSAITHRLPSAQTS